MILTAEELKWVANRMTWYDIKYQEVFDELNDHIITAIETARAAGDDRDIENVFQTVVDDHFGGYLGINVVATSYESAYRAKIKKAMLANYKYFFNRKGMVVLLVLAAIGFYMPQNRPTSIVMMIGLFVLALFPLVYALIVSFKIKTAKGKKSLAKSYVISRSNLLIVLLGGITNLLNFLIHDEDITSLKPGYPPAVFMVFIFMFSIYGLSVVKLCNQEFKLEN